MARPIKDPTMPDQTPKVVPHVTVTERRNEALLRRLENPDVDSYAASAIIQLRDDPTGEAWALRWVNTEIPNRYWVVKQKGYVTVPLADVLNPEDIAELDPKSTDGLVHRGERGKEILMKIPKADFLYIKRQEVLRREAKASSAAGLREQMAENAAAKFGSEAGDFMAGKTTMGGLIKPHVDVRVHQERMTPDDAA